MKQPGVIFYLFFITMMLLMYESGAIARSGSSMALTTNDTLASENSSSPHSLFTGLGYRSNMMYLGSTISHDKPFGYSSLTYGLHNQLFLIV
jgi:hypothetical protein